MCRLVEAMRLFPEVFRRRRWLSKSDRVMPWNIAASWMDFAFHVPHVVSVLTAILSSSRTVNHILIMDESAWVTG